MHEVWGNVILHDEKHNFFPLIRHWGRFIQQLRHERSYGSFVAFDGGEWCNQHRCAGASQCGFSDAEKFLEFGGLGGRPCQIYEPWYCRGGYIVTVLNVIYTNCNVHCTQYQGVQRLTIPLFSILLCKAQCFSKTLQFVNRGKCLFSNSLAHHCITTLSLAFLIQIGTQPLRGFHGLDWIHDQERCMEINLPWALIDAAQRRWVNEKMAMGQDSLGAVGTLGALGWWRNAQQIEINVTALTCCIVFLAKKDQVCPVTARDFVGETRIKVEPLRRKILSRSCSRRWRVFFWIYRLLLRWRKKIRLHLFAEEHFVEVFFCIFFWLEMWSGGISEKNVIQFRPCQFVMLRCGIHMNMFCCWRHWRHEMFVGLSPAKDIVRPTVSVWMAKMPKMRCRECCWERKSRLILGFAFHLIWNSIETNLWHWDTSWFCLCYKPRSPGTPEEDLGRIRLKNKKLFFAKDHEWHGWHANSTTGRASWQRCFFSRENHGV